VVLTPGFLRTKVLCQQGLPALVINPDESMALGRGDRGQASPMSMILGGSSQQIRTATVMIRPSLFYRRGRTEAWSPGPITQKILK
jgi:hypothetical protein